MRVFPPVAASGGYFLVVVWGLFIAVASLVVEHRIYGVWASVAATCGLSGKGSACRCRIHKFNPWFRKIPDSTEQVSPCMTTEPVL